MPHEGWYKEAIAYHAPAFGDVGFDLSYNVHNERFEPLRFPLVEGATWETRFAMGRLVAKETAINGCTFREGEMVMLSFPAANRDPAAFPDPDRFDITRHPNRHVAFGYGPHFCLGAPLARLEMEIAFRAIVRRLPGLRLASERLSWKPVMGIRALESLPVLDR